MTRWVALRAEEEKKCNSLQVGNGMSRRSFPNVELLLSYAEFCVQTMRANMQEIHCVPVIVFLRLLAQFVLEDKGLVSLCVRPTHVPASVARRIELKRVAGTTSWRRKWRASSASKTPRPRRSLPQDRSSLTRPTSGCLMTFSCSAGRCVCALVLVLACVCVCLIQHRQLNEASKSLNSARSKASKTKEVAPVLQAQTLKRLMSHQTWLKQVRACTIAGACTGCNICCPLQARELIEFGELGDAKFLLLQCQQHAEAFEDEASTANCLHELALLACLEGDVQGAVALESKAQQQPQDVEFWTRSAAAMTGYLLLCNQNSGAKEAAEQAIASVQSRLTGAPALSMLREMSLCVLQQSAARAGVALALECRAGAKPGFEQASEASCAHLNAAVASMEKLHAMPWLVRALLDAASVQVSLAELQPAALQAAYRKAAALALKAVHICSTLITQSVQPFADVANGVPALSSAQLLASAAHLTYGQYLYLLSVSVQQQPFVIRARPPVPPFPQLQGADPTPVLQYLDPLLNGQTGVYDIEYDQVAIADKAVSAATSAVNLCGSSESRALVQSRAALGLYLAHRCCCCCV